MSTRRKRRIYPDDMNEAERKAIAALGRLAKIWPRSLTLFSASGALVVVESNDAHTHELTPIEQTPDLRRIRNDGGAPDWTAEN